MDKKRNIVLVVAVLYIVYHLATLIYSPLPWFDEVDYAGVTHSWQKYGILAEEARNIDWKVRQLDLAYGPGYFLIQSFTTGLFGFSMFVFRFTDLIFGLGCLFLLYKICNHLKFRPEVTLLALLLVAFDPQFNQFLHSGRMDFIAVFGFFAAYLLLVKSRDYSSYKYLLKGVAMGALLGYAYLTTPRIMFTFPVFAVYFLYELIDGKFKNAKHIVFKYVTIALVFLGVFEIWVLHQFGSISNYILQTYTNSPIVKQHVGASGHIIYNYNLAMHVLALASLALLFVTRKVKENIEIVLFSAPALISFLFLVTGGISGRYYGVIVPFVTILFVGATVNAYRNLPSRLVGYTILGGFVALFIFKGSYIVGTLSQRDPAKYDKVFSEIIPDNSSVGGDFQYYYFARKHNWKYQFLEENGWLDDITEHFNKNKYDYFIVNKNNNLKSAYEERFLKDYTIVATIDNNTEGFFHKVISKLPVRITEGYGAYVYKYNGAKTN